MSDGAVVEEGTHDLLISKRGLYFTLVELQNSSMERGISASTSNNDLSAAAVSAFDVEAPLLVPSEKSKIGLDNIEETVDSSRFDEVKEVSATRWCGVL